MKKVLMIILILLLSITLIITFFSLWIYHENKTAENNNFLKTIGVYVLDTDKTSLGIYKNTTLKFKKLVIAFNKDGTFHMNMDVPFICDSSGLWNAGGGNLDDWNWLYYRSWNFAQYKKNTGDQFTRPWTSDSIFYINSATPKKGQQGINQIYFRKISTN